MSEMFEVEGLDELLEELSRRIARESLRREVNMMMSDKATYRHLENTFEEAGAKEHRCGVVVKTFQGFSSAMRYMRIAVEKAIEGHGGRRIG